MVDADKYSPSEEEIVWFGEVAGFEPKCHLSNTGIPELDEISVINAGLDPEELAESLVRTMVLEGPVAFCEFVVENRQRIIDASFAYPDIIQVLLVGYKLGISQKDASCANDLGTLYYMGDLVGQDYAKAAELYELAMNWGCYQSIINLGYIYEYGRIGEPDYSKAYMYFSLAAAFLPSSEALYKLGDMFARAHGVPCDMEMARLLWEHSLAKANNVEDEAQAAARIAPLLLDVGGVVYGAKYDPLRALHLYQTAEYGLRISVARGLEYYRKRLEEVIDGQEIAREALDPLIA